MGLRGVLFGLFPDSPVDNPPAEDVEDRQLAFVGFVALIPLFVPAGLPDLLGGGVEVDYRHGVIESAAGGFRDLGKVDRGGGRG